LELFHFVLSLTIFQVHLASFGAFISILAMAMIHSLSKSSSNYNCFPVSLDVEARMTRTNNLHGRWHFDRPGNAELNEHMSTAILLGTLDAAITLRPLIPFTCSSGNCTFPTDGTRRLPDAGDVPRCKEINDLIHTYLTFPGYWLEN